jgi:hypothetical protein
MMKMCWSLWIDRLILMLKDTKVSIREGAALALGYMYDNDRHSL